MSDAPGLEHVVERLRAPVSASPDFDQRVLARARKIPDPGRRPARLAAWALAAGLAALAAGAALVGSRAPESALVDFAIDAPAASTVALVGDFNDWDRRRTPLSRDAVGRWRARMPLEGGLYHYAFLVDGVHWEADPVRPRVLDADFGEALSLVTVE